MTEPSNSTAAASQSVASIPIATVQTARATPEKPGGKRLGTKLWWLTLLCFAVAVGLVVWAQKPFGPTIVIQFKDGYGIQPGNALQHRGIVVGEVTSVLLAPQADGVAVSVMLQPQAATLAREGTQFWIVRPRLSLTQMSGLETVVGAKYIGVQPGPATAAKATEFVGLETPLAIIDAEAVEIELRFREGNGLTVGDPVKHRGILVGEVTAVDLSEDFLSIRVRVRLAATAASLARAGSQFWVERPTVSAAEIRGLDTLLGGRYIAVQPAVKDAAPQTSFEGLEVAPPADVPEGGLEFVLEAGRRGALQRGVPVLYRGMRVGHIITVGLASDSASVEARAWIDSANKHLLRENTQFWMNDGIDVSVGLKGVKVSTEALSSLLIGGVSLATPDAPGKAVRTGHRFACAEKPGDDWQNWQPRLPLGAQAATGVELPRPLRASLTWRERSFGFKRDRQRFGWLLPLRDGRVLGPADLFRVPEKAVEGAVLEAAGEVLVLKPESLTEVGELTLFKLATPLAKDAECWPLSRLKPVGQPVDCLIVTAASESQLSVSASRFMPGAGVWQIDSSVPLTVAHHGGCVVSREDGNVLGLVQVIEGRASVVLIPSQDAGKTH